MMDFYVRNVTVCVCVCLIFLAHFLLLLHSVGAVIERMFVDLNLAFANFYAIHYCYIKPNVDTCQVLKAQIFSCFLLVRSHSFHVALSPSRASHAVSCLFTYIFQFTIVIIMNCVVSNIKRERVLPYYCI